MSSHPKTTQNDPIMVDGSDNEIIGRLEIEPGEATSLVLGIYEENFPEPDFHIELWPKGTTILTTLVRTDDPGEYKLTYHFQNFQNSTSRVTVRKCSSVG